MHCCIISGSHRKGANSNKIADYLAGLINNQELGDSEVIKLSEQNLPFWDEDLAYDNDKWQPLLEIREKLRQADSVIFITPEWSGMVPSRLKNLFLLISADYVGHKPGLLVAVSAGPGGSYPIAELRMSSYKNTKICYIPEHLIFRNVATLLEDAEKREKTIEDRAIYSLKLLNEYAKALTLIRKSGIIDNEKFPYGM